MEGTKEPGWEMHYVADDPDAPNHTDIHTHGLLPKYGHPELQLCLNIDPALANAILWGVVQQAIEKGRPLNAGEIRTDLLQGQVPIAVVNAISGKAPVLRLILPDPLLRVLPASIESGPYAEQWIGVLPPIPTGH